MRHHQQVNVYQPFRVPAAQAIAFNTHCRLHKGPMELKTSEFSMQTFKLNARLAVAQTEANKAEIKHTL